MKIRDAKAGQTLYDCDNDLWLRTSTGAIVFPGDEQRQVEWTDADLDEQADEEFGPFRLTNTAASHWKAVRG